MSNTKPQLTSKDWEINCPKCGGRCWRDEHPDGYMVGPWNCEDCSWFESNPNLPVQEEWIERFDFEIGQVWNSGTDYDQYDKSGVVKSFIQQEIDRAVKEERERCLECVGEDPRLMTLEDYPFDSGAYLLYAAEMANLQSRLREIRTKIKNG